MHYHIIDRLTPAQRGRVLTHSWIITQDIKESSFWIDPFKPTVCVNEEGDCPLACALGLKGAVTPAEVANALVQYKHHPEFIPVARAAEQFMLDADDGSPGEDITEWVHSAFLRTP